MVNYIRSSSSGNNHLQPEIFSSDAAEPTSNESVWNGNEDNESDHNVDSDSGFDRENSDPNGVIDSDDVEEEHLEENSDSSDKVLADDGLVLSDDREYFLCCRMCSFYND